MSSDRSFLSRALPCALVLISAAAQVARAETVKIRAIDIAGPPDVLRGFDCAVDYEVRRDVKPDPIPYADFIRVFLVPVGGGDPIDTKYSEIHDVTGTVKHRGVLTVPASTPPGRYRWQLWANHTERKLGNEVLVRELDENPSSKGIENDPGKAPSAELAGRKPTGSGGVFGPSPKENAPKSGADLTPAPPADGEADLPPPGPQPAPHPGPKPGSNAERKPRPAGPPAPAPAKKPARRIGERLDGRLSKRSPTAEFELEGRPGARLTLAGKRIPGDFVKVVLVRPDGSKSDGKRLAPKGEVGFKMKAPGRYRVRVHARGALGRFTIATRAR